MQNSLLEGHTFRDRVEVRKAAEDIARRSQASYQLGRLLNMKSRRKVQFVPGDLVYYRRVQPPADSPAHPGLGLDLDVGLGQQGCWRPRPGMTPRELRDGQPRRCGS